MVVQRVVILFCSSVGEGRMACLPRCIRVHIASVALSPAGISVSFVAADVGWFMLYGVSGS